jgi:DNA processing protein
VSAPTEEERLARAALSKAGEPGELRLLDLVRQIGAVATRARLLSEAGDADLHTDLAERLAATDPVAELERAERQGIRFVVPGDDEWPEGLDDLAHVEPVQQRGDVPVGLWVTGPLRLDEVAGGVAVVGSRSATTYGAAVAGDLAARVARAGVPVVSGAAFGIDQAGHRGALAVGGRTVAVLACGADRIYPQAHESLVRHIRGHGLVVSETAPGGAPTRIRFLSRNRLIATLTAGTVVVEAAVRSGALNTANWAERSGRVLMGVPGPVTSAPSQGVHHLIRQGAATLVTTGEEVLELVGASGQYLLEEPRGPARPRDRLGQRHQRVLEAVPVGRPAGADSIALAAGIGLLEVRTSLQRLLALGLVERGDTGWRLDASARE